MDWAVRELASVDLGDQRLDLRLMRIVEGVAARPNASLPEALGEDGCEAAYRFFDNERVDPSAILAAHAESTAHRAAAHHVVLAVQDTSEANLTSHPTTAGLGYLGSSNCRGLMLHSLLAVSPLGTPLGVLWQKSWARPVEELGKRHTRRQRDLTEKESQRWLDGLHAAEETLLHHPHVVVIGDRESDMFPLFTAPRRAGVDLLVRVCRESRRVEHACKYLDKAMEAQPVGGVANIRIPQSANRAERLAALTVRWSRLTVHPPKYHPQLPAVELTFILVEEKDPPAGESPVRWLLATTLAVSSSEDALRYVQWYAFRWVIERFHFVLKSGCRIEERQLASAERIQRAIPTFSIVAWRILYMTLQARETPDALCTRILDTVSWQVLFAAMHPRTPFPDQPPTIREAVRMIAKLGGFLGRKGDGEPGPKTLWKGWQRLDDMVQGWLLRSQNNSTLASIATSSER